MLLDKAPACTMQITHCKRRPHPLPKDLSDRAQLVSTCVSDSEKWVSWSAIVNKIGSEDPFSLVVIDPTGNCACACVFHVFILLFNLSVFTESILDDILNEPNHLPNQIYVRIQQDVSNTSGMLTRFNDLYFKGGYIPVYEAQTDSMFTTAVLLVKMVCVDSSRTSNTQSKYHGRPLLIRILYEMMYAKLGVKLPPLLTAEKFMSVYKPNSRKCSHAIHQTVKNAFEIKRLSAPSYYAINSWSVMNPKWMHVMWFDKDIDDFIFRFFPQFVDTHKRLAGVQKSDFFRYLVVYQFGGVYADLDVICFQNILNMMNVPGVPPQSEATWREQVQAAYKIFPNHPMISKLYQSKLSSSNDAEPRVLWFSNGNTSALKAHAVTDGSVINHLFIGEERTTVDRPDENILYPIQYLQWWFMATAPKHSALLAVVEQIAFRVRSMSMDVTRTTRIKKYMRGKNHFTLWLTGKIKPVRITHTKYKC
jgi:hypothetical protein